MARLVLFAVFLATGLTQSLAFLPGPARPLLTRSSRKLETNPLVTSALKPRSEYEQKWKLGPEASEEPLIGFHNWPEKINGRLAMMGFVGLLAFELVTQKPVLSFVLEDFDKSVS
uniref:High light inducible protein n=1 Tax=Chromera velia CCMP2878 TaxID=1169474 RepID=A0A0G4IDE3_9ALVE|mmetsp:Transcript_39045/g.76795  ORF Transcript_39045/g.76795 Transcript_39045/m.76795 type:complete len:115 (+) Transcript_39045:153-497(+)|eukprot:Cvel_13380.t1-p1 / transcript=Cvel_13380.t1 / gene=Cvel_13380 / organism=Chromera_velia_CCMP2878 / gene_product=hypothetical protein / transcript_product=hypothetical protein / location=Cvel_scaffold910:54614-55043(+) / protein_length=114 / sequence_SO=supercontig / SO=protein_coding / is_pseudo=false